MLHAGRIVPVYRLTAGLTAARLRVAMREASTGRATPIPSTSRRTCAQEADLEGRSPPRSRPPTTRRRSRPGTPPCAASPSTSCWPSSWGWSGGGGRAAATMAPVIAVDDATDAAIRAALVDAIGATDRRRRSS